MIKLLTENSEAITALVTAIVGGIIRAFEKRKMKKEFKQKMEISAKG